MSSRGLRNGLARMAVAALAVGLSAGEGTAQDGGAAFGMKGGVNFASFRGEGAVIDNGRGAVSPGNRVGFVGGVFVTIPLRPTALIQPEVVYAQKGARYASGGDEVVWEAHYVEFPLLLKVRLGSGAARPALFIGPAAAFKLNARVVGRSADGEEDENTEVGESVRSVDWGLVFGGGVDIAAGDGSLTLEGRYTLGLSPFAKDPEPGQTRSGVDPKNGVLSFQVGYAF